MKKKAVSGIMLTLLLISMLSLAFNIQTVRASGTIYIRADGSVEPSTAPISSVDNVTYTFTDNIYDEIVVERDNIVVDGGGYTLQGIGVLFSKGIDLSYRSNVTIKNMELKAFWSNIYLMYSSNITISGNDITGSYAHGIDIQESSNITISGNNITECTTADASGIILRESSHNIISGNTITNNYRGITLSTCSNNSISGNNITANFDDGISLASHSSCNSIYGNNITANNQNGIFLLASSRNTISGNSITNNYDGIHLGSSSNDNSISGNSIANNEYGIYVTYSFNNEFHHNNFINNTQQVYDYSWDDPTISPSINIWDDSYLSGGNYWSDYNGTDFYSGPYQNETGSDGIGDTPYVIDENNEDRYPLMNPWGVNIPILGDVNGDGIVDIFDVVIAAVAFGSYPGHPNWNPKADLKPDNLIDIFDLVIIGIHFGEKDR